MNHEQFADSIYLDRIPTVPPRVPASDSRYVKHVNCNGARFHVLSYSTEGVSCSEPNCIVNKEDSP